MVFHILTKLEPIICKILACKGVTVREAVVLVVAAEVAAGTAVVVVVVEILRLHVLKVHPKPGPFH